MVRRVGLALLLCGCGGSGGGGGETGDTSGGTTSSSATTASTSATPTSADGSTSAGVTSTAGESDSGSESSTTGSGCAPDFAETHRYVWVSNRTQGTISKIDAERLTEVGRYYTREDMGGGPASISVGRNGNVAVAHQLGVGVTMIYANPDDCVDADGSGDIQTSGDSTPLDWGVEECVAWVAHETDYDNQSAVAWTPGTWSIETCRFEDEFVWTSGTVATDEAEVLLIDALDGSIVDSASVTGFNGSTEGLVAAAVDRDGDYWAIPTGADSLVRVVFEGAAVDILTPPMPNAGRGITVDSDGRVFICGDMVNRYDPAGDVWTTSPGQVGSAPFGGCGLDGAGLLWSPVGMELIAVNTDDLQIDSMLDTPVSVNGLGIGFDGNLWATELVGQDVIRVDPSNGSTDTLSGFVDLFNPGDPTGFQLVTASQP